MVYEDRKMSDRAINKISQQMISLHRQVIIKIDKAFKGYKFKFQEMEVICEEFRDIKRKALEVPKSTEQFFENSEYMLSVYKLKR